MVPVSTWFYKLGLYFMKKCFELKFSYFLELVGTFTIYYRSNTFLFIYKYVTVANNIKQFFNFENIRFAVSRLLWKPF